MGGGRWGHVAGCVRVFDSHCRLLTCPPCPHALGCLLLPACLTPRLYCTVLLPQASYEEELLEERYGEEYRQYRKDTKKLIPYIY